MIERPNPTVSDQEAFENAFHYFVQALDLLSENAETQCSAMGNYNVAWELKEDVTAAVHMLELPNVPLSQEQRAAISDLIVALADIPANVLRGSGTAAENLDAMRHPCWIPLRTKASALRELLQPAVRRNKEFFKPKNRGNE